MDSLKTQLLQHRLEEISLHEKIVSDLRALNLGARTTRAFCEKELGYSFLETRAILISLGLILTTEAMVSTDAVIQARIDKLREWRRKRSNDERVPAYRVLTNRELMKVASETPKAVESWRELKGLGTKRSEVYGTELLALFNS